VVGHLRLLLDATVGDIGKMTAQNVMTKDVVCRSPDDEIGVAINVMETKHVRHLPVTRQSQGYHWHVIWSP
jgi:predicted transcriptional regulator